MLSLEDFLREGIAGSTNNDMLRLHIELNGDFPKKMLKKAHFWEQHFDEDFRFCVVEEDPVTKKMVKRFVRNDYLVRSKGVVSSNLQFWRGRCKPSSETCWRR